MTVQDVFAHVLDLFQLVNESDPEAREQVVWRLVSATMNSPFTVTAEAVAARPDVRVEQIAKQQKRAFRNNLRQLQQGSVPLAWSTPKVRETVSKVLARNRNGIGVTRIDAGVKTEKPIVITPDEAARAAIAVAVHQPTPHVTKQQVGSLDGTLVQVATHYNQPAIQLVERKSGNEVWCIVPEAFQHEISEHTSVEDVWKGSRVVVRGTLVYGADGKLSRVVATDVRRVEARNVAEGELTDKGFTAGLSVIDYLEQLREGTLG
ncbi:MAG: hypothetical protein JWQ76_4543 [Ramlibacter sp.]|nr:hypothetical protein [Ramlibacter sp.]